MGGILGDLDGGLYLSAGGQLARLSRLLIGGLGQLGHLSPGCLNLVCHNSFYTPFFSSFSKTKRSKKNLILFS